MKLDVFRKMVRSAGFPIGLYSWLNKSNLGGQHATWRTGMQRDAWRSVGAAPRVLALCEGGINGPLEGPSACEHVKPVRAERPVPQLRLFRTQNVKSGWSRHCCHTKRTAAIAAHTRD
jgi:hypothetical protein